MRSFPVFALAALAAVACHDAAAPDKVGPGRGLTADFAAATPVTVLDALGAATPDTRFSVFGSGGKTVLASQLPGPEFALPQPTTLTEIGAFLNNCKAIVAGVPQCPGALPFTVQIRPARNGAPDPATLLATLTLSHDDDPLVVAYESVAPDLTLGPGSYFALFAPQGDDQGYVMNTASDPFTYRADAVTTGFLNPITGDASASTEYLAVRILGSPATPAAALQLLLGDVRALVSTGTLSETQGGALAGTLAAAATTIDRAGAAAACGPLRAFVVQVQSLVQRGQLSGAAGQALIDTARWIMTQIGCGTPR